MRARAAKSSSKSMLTSVAESIGETLGTIAAKANSAQEAVTRSPLVRSVRRSANKLVPKAKRTVRRIKESASTSSKRRPRAKHTRQGSARAGALVPRAARNRRPKVKTAVRGKH